MEEQDEYLRPPRDKRELVSRIEREWDLLERFLARTSPDQMLRPDAGGWSPKDNLAHLATWLNYMRFYHLRDQPPHEVMGIDAATFEKLDENGVNQIIFERNKDRPLDEVLGELRERHRLALADLEAMSFEHMLKPQFADDPDKRPLLQEITGNTCDHYRQHRLDMERGLASSATGDRKREAGPGRQEN